MNQDQIPKQCLCRYSGQCLCQYDNTSHQSFSEQIVESNKSIRDERSQHLAQYDDMIKTKWAPATYTNKNQLLSALQNLSSNIETTAEIMKRSGDPEMRSHATELSGAWEMVEGWIKGIEKI